MNFEVLKIWKKPYPCCDPTRLRLKEFKIVRLENGNYAFCKVDAASEYIKHEAEILRVLNDLVCVPSLIFSTSTAIFTTYIKGRLLTEVIGNLRMSACINICWQIFMIVVKIHKKGIVHGDIRPWNFIYDGTNLYLIDFEYAYSKFQESEKVAFIKIHHGQDFKTPLHDWVDAWSCVMDLWKKSSYWLVKDICVCLSMGIIFGIRKILVIQPYFCKGY